jgi:nitrate reductase gamma subunit
MFEQFVNGLLWKISAVVFVVGVVMRIFAILRHGRRKDLAEPRGSAFAGAVWTNISRFKARPEISEKIRFQTLSGYMFHLGLFVLLLFAAPHIEFIKEHILGFGWPALPNAVFIISTQISLLGLLFLLMQRLMNPVTRLISRPDNYISIGLLFLVMLTGCLVYFQPDSGLAYIHLFTMELLMLYFPFSNLMHAFLFVSSRAYTGALFGTRGMKV